MSLVTGILPTCDPKEIERTLVSAGVDTSKVRVVTKGTPTRAHDESIVGFIFVAESQGEPDISGDMTHGTGIMSDSGGTSVPGNSDRSQTLRAFTHGDDLNYFTGFPIPSDHLDTYNDAVDGGDCVVTYEIDGGTAAVVAAFKTAGLRDVQAFN